jgi:RNA polymerase sigma-70 factor (ECF subfamily)
MNGQNIARALPVAAAGDPVERLAGLFDAHHDRLYRLARRLTASADDALDLVQETFLRAAKSPNSIPAGASNEEAWFVRVLINIRRDQWRKASVRARHDKAVFAASHPAPGAHGPEAALIARTAIWQALNLLSPRRRAIIVLHELEGLVVPAIASLLGISAITVRWHLAIGRRDLTHALKAHWGDTHDNS